MARVEFNRFGEMDVFVQVVRAGGFSAAARAAGLSPSAVSKLVSRLEARLGVRLILRSTRQFQLTAEGQGYYDRAIRVLADLNEAERVASAGDRPSGPVRVNSSASYVTHVLAPILPVFLETYPDVTLDIAETDAVVDLIADRSDIAIRAGPLPSSSLTSRRLGATRMIIAASPAWIAKHGMPRTQDDLAAATRIGFSYVRALKGWPLSKDGVDATLSAPPRVRVSDGEGIRRLALAGVGPARLAHFTIRDDLAAGRLVPILEEHNPGDTEEFHAMFVGQAGPLPVRARVFLDYLADHGRVS